VTARRLAPAGAALLVALAAAGCGVPVGDAPTTIAPSDVPYGLASPTEASPSTASPVPRADEPLVFLVGPGDLLVPRGRGTGTGTPADRLDALLAALAAGPTEGERAEGLSTALPPGVELGVTGDDDGTVTVDLGGPVDAPSGRESRSAVAQVVLTATSLPGVDAVLLTRDGVPVEAPLPSGELTSAPLTEADYAVFLTSPPT
jgi:hypothetical protein